MAINRPSTETAAPSQPLDPHIIALGTSDQPTAFVPNPEGGSNGRTDDAWDAQQIGDLMALNGNKVTFIGSRDPAVEGGNSAFLSNIVDRGVHRYAFKVELRFCHWWASTIGIWKCSDDSSPPRNDIFTLGEHRGYGLNLSEGTLVDVVNGKASSSASRYGQRCIGTKVIEMVLDLDQLELKFVIDGHDFGTAFSVQEGAYRAAVNLSRVGDSMELI